MASGARPPDSGSSDGHSASRLPGLSPVNDLFSAGRVRELTNNYQDTLQELTNKVSRVRVLLTVGMGHYELGHVVDSLAVLREAYETARTEGLDLQFQAALALFSRESQFQTPEETLPALSRLRQLASSLGERTSVGGLHFVVARLEALRGHCVDARRHAEIGRHVLRFTNNVALRSAVELVDSALETNAGNLSRAVRAARTGLDLADSASLSVTVAGCLVNLGAISLFFGDSKRARHYVESALNIGDGLQMIAVSGLDNLAQIYLHEGNLGLTREVHRQMSGHNRSSSGSL